MYKEVLRSIEGIGILPALGLILFFTFFVGVIIHVLYKDRSYWQNLAKIPLDEDHPVEKKNNTE